MNTKIKQLQAELTGERYGERKMKIKKIENWVYKNLTVVDIVLDARIPGIAGTSEQAELRIKIKPDGTFEIVTNLKVKQARDMQEYQLTVPVERFGYPED